MYDKQDEARAVLEAANRGASNPFAVPYLAFVYDDLGRAADAIAVCKEGVSAKTNEGQRVAIIEACLRFTPAQAASSGWLSQKDRRFYERWVSDQRAKIAAANERTANRALARCDQDAALYSSFSNSGAYNASVQCAAADAAANDRYVSIAEAILTMVPRAITIESQCRTPVEFYLGTGIFMPNSPTQTLAAGASKRVSVRSNARVTLKGATSVTGSLSMSAGVRKVFVDASCVSLRAE